MTTTDVPATAAKRTLDWPALRQAAKGHWSDIFRRLIDKELGPAMANAPYHVSCPVHGGENGYRLFDHYNDTGRGICNTCGPQKSGFETLVWVKRVSNPAYSLDDAGADVARWAKGEFKHIELPPLALPSIVKMDPELAWRKMYGVLSSCTGFKDTAVERYLLSRGIWQENIPGIIRAHPGLDYYDKKTKSVIGNFPCLIAPMKDVSGKIICVQRIYLTEDGEKAPVPDAKKYMSACGDVSGICIQLFPAEETLAVTEGLETGLAVRAITRLPVWAATTAGLLETLEVPPNVRRVIIFADLDRSMRGEIAAERLADRLEAKGIAVEVYYPQGPIPENKKGIDWLRVLITQGLNGFPAKWRKWRPN